MVRKRQKGGSARLAPGAPYRQRARAPSKEAAHCPELLLKLRVQRETPPLPNRADPAAKGMDIKSPLGRIERVIWKNNKGGGGWR